MPKKRRSGEEIDKLMEQIDAAIAGGMSITQATTKYDVGENVYRRRKKGLVKRVSGSIRADSLPPRPKKSGKREPKQIDMNDIGSVATRIARLDKKLRNSEDLVKERIDLVAQLLKLLKKK